jgi:hypothetical protein
MSLLSEFKEVMGVSPVSEAVDPHLEHVWVQWSTLANQAAEELIKRLDRITAELRRPDLQSISVDALQSGLHDRMRNLEAYTKRCSETLDTIKRGMK